MLTDIGGINSFLNAACGEENVARIDHVTASVQAFCRSNKIINEANRAFRSNRYNFRACMHVRVYAHVCNEQLSEITGVTQH